MTLGVYILWVLGKNVQESEFRIFPPVPCRGTPNLPRSISAITYTALCICRHAASEQCHYAGFYVAKIPGKNLTLENSQHHIGESRPIG